MRLKLTIAQEKPNQLIPINYQYPISSFIYHTIAKSDNDYAKWLHQKGFASGNKKFKLFTFSMLNIPEREVEEDRIRIKSTTVELIISMLSSKTLENFIIGMFEKQRFKIYDKKSEAEFNIHMIETIPEPTFKNTVRFKTISPIVLSKREIYKGKESEGYLKPDDKDYFNYFKKNLEEKYLSYCIATEQQVHEYNIEEFKIISDWKARLITIKADTVEETKVKGYLFNFEVGGDRDFIRFGYETGFGKLNSLGFGCVKVL